ncbi:MAG: D-alanyl-D-alanine carboxypeptidase [Clostridiales bacterium]|jgi:D-alanyl-D-alanine carboxypeptidase (penicillin-binding protein 5/6)|nr:D-alanyl-D-alanine carboxypeptidase [Clostridiales bacterium]
MKKFFTFLIIIILAAAAPLKVFATPVVPAAPAAPSVPVAPTPAASGSYLPLMARSAILTDVTSGKILYSKEEGVRVYPASMTKILTVLVALEYLQLSEFVTVGDEILSIPYDSSKAYNEIGEVMSVENMIRLIIIPSGNETSCVAARTVAAKVTGDPDISYPEAELVFCGLMNEKARELGAYNSNFVNPHGYHDNNHFTTAYDLALICRAAVENEFIRQVVRERMFAGTGAPQLPDNSRKLVEHSFETTNELIIPDSNNYYPYATGMKTGSTGEAGECLAASAEKDGKSFIAIVFDSPNGGRWGDVTSLFEYGFNNYNMETVQNANEIVESIPITNPRLGDEELLEIKTTKFYEDFMTKADLAAIERSVKYNEKFVTPERDKNPERTDIINQMQFMAPIAAGEVLANVTYTLNGAVIFEDNLVAVRGALERTRESDFEYYKNMISENIFTINALPYWCMAFTLLFMIIQIIVFIVRRKRRKRNRYRSYY